MYICLLTLLIALLYFFLEVNVEMKGKHGYLSASDWPLYPVMNIRKGQCCCKHSACNTLSRIAIFSFPQAQEADKSLKCGKPIE